MEARAIGIALFTLAIGSMGASHRSLNFVVTAPTPQVAEQVAVAAEKYRRELAIQWVGHELPRWYTPCPVKVRVGQIGAGGATSFSFDQGHVFGWNMVVQGSLERILDSVLPHEVTHTILACHFRYPLPRWADEGAATLAENESERRIQILRVRQAMDSKRLIPLHHLLNMTEYPQDMQQVLTLYAQGYTLAELLVQRGGRTHYLALLADARTQGWDRALRHHYGYSSVADLGRSWKEWILAGSPRLDLPADEALAAHMPAPRKRARSKRARKGEPGLVVRSQTPEHPSRTSKQTGLKHSGPRSRRQRSRESKPLIAPMPRLATRVTQAGSDTERQRQSSSLQRRAVDQRYGNDGWVAVQSTRRSGLQSVARKSTRVRGSRNSTAVRSASGTRRFSSRRNSLRQGPPSAAGLYRNQRVKSSSNNMRATHAYVSTVDSKFPRVLPVTRQGQSDFENATQSTRQIPAALYRSEWSNFPQRPRRSLPTDPS